MLIALKRIIRYGWLNFIRNGGISAATIFIIFLTVSLISSLFLLRGLTDFVIVELQEKVDISVYFKTTADEEEVLRIKDEVTRIPEVKEVRYISREDALEKFMERYRNNEVVLESIKEIGNPLLSSLSIKAWQATQYEAVISFFENSSYDELIDKVDYYERKPVIEKIFSATANVNKIGFVFSAILAAFAGLVAYNAIRMAIHDSREEIGIMRLVGASNFLIRAPFMLQGIIFGLVAAAIASMVFAGVIYFVSPKLEVIVPGFSIYSYFEMNFWIVFGMQFAVGAGLGFFSSRIAVRKYLCI
ncbi:MAG: permease-like cell division protein FtsX [bacterium]